MLVKSNISPEPCKTEINLFMYSGRGMPDAHVYRESLDSAQIRLRKFNAVPAERERIKKHRERMGH